MSFKVRLSPLVERQIKSWHLDDLVVDVYLALQHDLPSMPRAKLLRERDLVDGMVYVLKIVDPLDRLTEHKFFFHVAYGADEETLHVLRGFRRMDSGMP